MKCLVDAQMVQTYHLDYVVTPNIYLDTKRYEARTQGMHATSLTLKPGSMRSLKVEELHSTVNTVGPNDSR
jgi:hypothetical protein